MRKASWKFTGRWTRQASCNALSVIALLLFSFSLELLFSSELLLLPLKLLELPAQEQKLLSSSPCANANYRTSL